MLRWRLILEDYGPDIEYIKGEKNIVSDALSIFPLNGNQENTHKSSYKGKFLTQFPFYKWTSVYSIDYHLR